MVQHLFDTKREAKSHWRFIQQEMKASGIAMPKNPLILYVGCGYGYMLDHLSKKYDVIGLEIDDVGYFWEDMSLKIGIQGDAHNLPFQNESIDMIFESGLMDLSKYELNQEKIIEEFYRVIKPKGIFCHRDADLPKDKMNKLFKLGPLSWAAFVYTKR